MNLTQHGKDKINCFILCLHKNASKLLADNVQLQLIYSKAIISFEQHNKQFAIVEIEAFASRTSCYESLMLDDKCFGDY